MKKLEEMKLVDDFLTYSLTSHKIYGEEASRYILGCVLQRRIGRLTVVPQRSWPGEEPGKHGVRMDVYLEEEDGEIFDVEPDNNSGDSEVKALPRRVRFYHSKIDAGNLASGEDYSVLRNVMVVFITTYDPFGYGRMIYTVRNSCTELPELSYEDGAKTIFLYTRGTEGNPPKELKQLLRYMEHSTQDNAGSAGLARLHEMVTEVKRDREVGLAYMKSCEIERRIREEGKKEGIEKGREQGRTEGKAESLLLLLSDLGEVPEDMRSRVFSEKDPDVLNSWLRAARRAESMEELVKVIVRS
ncbi:MAG: Rpn family recombination-promoting nuclease/putative transposase [Acetatifactor sp.]|nr:Rpn family recombination-promoting nuclease/putative transposase [Acetatifactor sp.]